MDGWVGACVSIGSMWGIPGGASVREPACQYRQLKEMWV